MFSIIFTFFKGFLTPKYIAYIVLAVALSTGYFTWRSHQRDIGAAPYIEAIRKQKEEAAAFLEKEKAKVALLDSKLKLLEKERKENDVNNAKIVESYEKKLAASVSSTKRLRDPKGCGNDSSNTQSGNSSNPGNSAEDRRNGSGLLSEDLTQLLLQEFKRADEINVAYSSCKNYVETLHFVCNYPLNSSVQIPKE